MTYEVEDAVGEFLRRIRAAWVDGVQITSWVRTPAKNDEVGGEVDSQHLIGTAVDVVGPNLPYFAIRCTEEGLICVNEPDHLHVQLFQAGATPWDEPPFSWGDLAWISRALNSVLGGSGDETLSARMGRRMREGIATPPERALCSMLDVVDPDHCLKAALREEGGITEPGVCPYCSADFEECDCGHHHHHPHRHPPECPEEPWWLRCPDPDREEDE